METKAMIAKRKVWEKKAKKLIAEHMAVQKRIRALFDEMEPTIDMDDFPATRSFIRVVEQLEDIANIL